MRLRAWLHLVTVTLCCVATAQPVLAQFDRSPLPILRPESSPTTQAAAAQVPASTPIVARSPFPLARPEAAAAKAVLAMAKKPKQGRKGSVCGVAAIRGQSVAPVPGKLNGCGISNPVKITAIGDVALSTPATIDCNTAKALHRWVEKGAKPALKAKGGGLAKLRVAASYSCRTRNHKKGAKISEHGKGRAIDISGMWLRNGAEITLLNGWNSKAYGKALRRMHKAACGPFGTVLGPESDRFHRDHFHFDTARYRSGSYCR